MVFNFWVGLIGWSCWFLGFPQLRVSLGLICNFYYWWYFPDVMMLPLVRFYRWLIFFESFFCGFVSLLFAKTANQEIGSLCTWSRLALLHLLEGFDLTINFDFVMLNLYIPPSLTLRLNFQDIDGVARVRKGFRSASTSLSWSQSFRICFLVLVLLWGCWCTTVSGFHLGTRSLWIYGSTEGLAQAF